MKIRPINNQIDSKVFNHAVLHPTQSWEWYEALTRLKFEIMRIGEYKEHKLQNAFSIYFKKIPYTLFKIGYLSMSSYPSKAVCRYLKTIAELKNCIVLKVKLATFLDNNKDSLRSAQQDDALLRGTLIINLRRSEQELLAAMKPKTRYNVRLAERKHVYVKETTNNQGLRIFYRLYRETCQRKRYQGETYNYFKTLYETLSKSMFHIFIASYKLTPLAANLIIHFHDKIYYAYGGTSNRHRSVMAPHLLMWEIIRYGKRKRINAFDMAGISFNDPKIHNPRAGFTRFKVGFGGVRLQYVDSFDIIGDKDLYKRNIFEDIKLYPRGKTGLLIVRKSLI